MLRELLQENRARLIAASVQEIRDSITSYAQTPVQEIERHVTMCIDAYLLYLESGSFEPMMEFIHYLSALRSEEEFKLSAMQRAFMVYRDQILPILVDGYQGDLAKAMADLEQVTRTQNRVLQLFSDIYQEKVLALLRSRNEQLQAANRELQEARDHLEERVQEAVVDLQGLQQFNEDILQSMTSGLMVVGNQGHHIQKYNQAMERITGIAPSEALGRPVEEVFARVRGIPFSLFYDEMAQRARVERTKLRLVRDSGEVVYRYLKAETFYNRDGESKGILVVVDDVTENEVIKDSFSRYVTRQVVEKILLDKGQLKLDGVRQEVTVLFADVRGFTPLSATLEPEQVVALLNRYFSLLVDIIFKHEGTLDKFVGDNVMAVFGAPFRRPDDVRRAVLAALEMQEELKQLNRRQRQEGSQPLIFGMGINTGEAIVGNIGSERRMDYTVIGDTVNVADRLQALARRGEIIISQPTYDQVQDLVTVRARGPIQLAGRLRPVETYEVVGQRGGGPRGTPLQKILDRGEGLG